ncbi:ThiF family adenylyltransferase [Croceiramulus getboli]|nr:HesA/MoeB/ThiF family protein [Flavobacteriaceae bacterium YJPT1-3]
MKDIGLDGQQRLQRAKVLVVGAGGLGCPALQYLAGAGVGTLGIIDFDTVSLSNLQRQLLFTETDIGKNKAITARDRLQRMNSEIDIMAYPEALGLENAANRIAAYDLVIDGTDNFVTRYLINDVCVKLDKPFIYGSIYKFEGQVAVFNHQGGPTYRCLFPQPPQAGEVPNCNEVGVLGVVPGQIGLLQATEALKWILNWDELLSGELLHLNVLTQESRKIRIERKEEHVLLIKEQPLRLVDTADCHWIASVAISQALQNEKNPVWLDVREPHEHPRLNFPEVRTLPLTQLEAELEHLDPGQVYYVFCQSGKRAQQAAKLLQERGMDQVYPLKEGSLTNTTSIKQGL